MTSNAFFASVGRPTKRAWLWVALGTAALGVASAAFAYRSGSGRAYLDLVRGNPQYFVVTGPPSDHPTDLPPAVRELEHRGVQIVSTGCVLAPDQDAYNAVVERHFRK